jgi:hypothetical protein
MGSQVARPKEGLPSALLLLPCKSQESAEARAHAPIRLPGSVFWLHLLLHALVVPSSRGWQEESVSHSAKR